MKRKQLNNIIIPGIILIGFLCWIVFGVVQDKGFGFVEFIVLTFGLLTAYFLIISLMAKKIYGIVLFSIVCFAICDFTAIALGLKVSLAFLLFFAYILFAMILTAIFRKPFDMGDNQKEGYTKYNQSDEDDE